MHAVACGDWDRDGDIDLFIETGGAVNGDKYHNLLFQNPGQGNHWLTIKLKGRKTNRAAIGARVTVVAGDIKQFDEVRSGSSYCSQNDLRLHFGFGSNLTISSVEVAWSSGKKEVIKDLPTDFIYTITEEKGVTDKSPLDGKPDTPKK